MTRRCLRACRARCLSHVENKIDLAGVAPEMESLSGATRIRVSAKTGEGMDHLRRWLLGAAGWKSLGEGLFLARERHIQALEEAKSRLLAATNIGQAFELMAEELRLAQVALGGITGEVTADHLLGEIFSRFCIGK